MRENEFNLKGHIQCLDSGFLVEINGKKVGIQNLHCLKEFFTNYLNHLELFRNTASGNSHSVQFNLEIIENPPKSE